MSDLEFGWLVVMGVNKAQRKLSPGSGVMHYPPPGSGPMPMPMMEKAHTLRNYANDHFRSPIPSPKSSIAGMYDLFWHICLDWIKEELISKPLSFLSRKLYMWYSFLGLDAVEKAQFPIDFTNYQSSCIEVVPSTTRLKIVQSVPTFHIHPWICSTKKI